MGEEAASAAEIVRRFLRAYGTGDRDAVAVLLAPTATIHQPAGLPHAGTYVGPDGFWQMVGHLAAAVEVAAASLEVHDVGPGLALSRMEVTFTGRASGTAVTTPVVELTHVVDGRIQLIEPYYQRALELAALV